MDSLFDGKKKLGVPLPKFTVKQKRTPNCSKNLLLKLRSVVLNKSSCASLSIKN